MLPFYSVLEISNAVKYLHQCEGLRKNDVSVLSLQLMSWAWFVPVQAKNYPNVTFPGHVYHPHIPGAYSIAKFLEANWHKAPIFLCGMYQSWLGPIRLSRLDFQIFSLFHWAHSNRTMEGRR